MVKIVGNFIPKDWVENGVRVSNYNTIEILGWGFIDYPCRSHYWARVARKLAFKIVKERESRAKEAKNEIR